MFRIANHAEDGSDSQTRKLDKNLRAWVIKNVKSEFSKLIITALLALAVSLLSSYSIYYASHSIEIIIKESDTSIIIWYMIKVFLLLISVLVIGFISSLISAKATTNIKKNLEINFFSHLSGIPYSEVNENTSGSIPNVVFNEISVVSRFINGMFRFSIQAPLTIIFFILIIILKYSIVVLWIILPVPIIYLVMRHYSSKIKAITKKTFRRLSSLYSAIYENINGLKVIKLYNLSNWFYSNMKRLSLEIAENTRLSMLYSAVQGFFQELISTIIFLFIAIYLAFQVKAGNILISEALFIVAAIVYIKNEGNNITSGIIEYRKILGAVSNLKEFLTPRIYSKQANLIESPVNSLEAKNLFFSYGENKIFEEVNIKFNSGEFVVLTGDSGAGKTTFLDLCLRVKEPLQGNILYNGIDLQSVSEDCLRTKTALVEQEPFLFNGSINYNLSLIKNDISDDEIFETLELVNLVKYAKELKEGIDTDLGLLGSKVSVGQKQRLSIARIFLKNPDVIFLDEFTSNLDENNEEIVLDNLREFGKHKIIICTSHRNNVIRNADRTFIIKNYHLIEK